MGETIGRGSRAPSSGTSGTIGYVAQEQVRGLPAEYRADIFALGALLYEMVKWPALLRK